MADATGAEAGTADMGHYARLQEIEKRVVYAIEAASYVMDQLSKEREHIDKRLLHTSATAFLQQIQEAQQFVLAAIKAAAPDRDFEANNYFLMLQAMAAAEKLDAVSVHISGISRVLRDQQQSNEPTEGSLPPSDAMIVDDVGVLEAVVAPDAP